MWNAEPSKAIWSVLCMRVCVCLFVPVTSSFIFTHRGLSAEARQPPEQVRWDPKPAWLFVHTVSYVRLIPSVFAVVTLRGNEEAANTTANQFSQSQNPLIRRGITLSVSVCVCSLWVIKDFWLLVYCLSEVSFVWMWLVPALSSSMHAQEKMRPTLKRAPFGQKIIVVGGERKKKMSPTALVFGFPGELEQHANTEEHKNTNISTRTQIWKGRWK